MVAIKDDDVLALIPLVTEVVKGADAMSASGRLATVKAEVADALYFDDSATGALDVALFDATIVVEPSNFCAK